MSDEEKDTFPGKDPGEGSEPAEQTPTDDHGGGGDVDGSDATGAGPSGGAPADTSTTSGGTSDATTGAGPSGGA